MNMVFILMRHGQKLKILFTAYQKLKSSKVTIEKNREDRINYLPYYYAVQNTLKVTAVAVLPLVVNLREPA